MVLLPGIARALLNNEISPLRFERFCVELLAESEQITILPTSRSWDQGRDGRGIGVPPNGNAILCASLASDIDEKVSNDFQRLEATSKPETVFYCTTRPLSEHTLDAMKVEIRTICPSVANPQMLAQDQLVRLAENYPEITQKYYSAEIRNVEQAVAAEPSHEQEAEMTGLRLALITQTGEDAQILRAEIGRRLVLEALAQKSPQPPGQIATSVSAQLHLGRSMSGTYVRQLVAGLIRDGLATEAGEGVSLSDDGRKLLDKIPEEAGERLLEGRRAVHETILALSGIKLTDDEYGRVWDTFQDALAEMFRSHGASIVRVVGSLLSGSAPDEDPSFRLLLERMGDRIGALFSGPERGEEVRQAVIDMFAEKDSPAFGWLTQVCSVYVMMCSLGLETLSADQVSKALRNFHMVADTDVTLSVLCEGEANHEEVVRILKAWTELGGNVLTATPVLEECAYHAWIARLDYNDTVHLLDRIDDNEAQHAIANAFVRAFRVVAKPDYGLSRWNSYINEYRGLTLPRFPGLLAS